MHKIITFLRLPFYKKLLVFNVICVMLWIRIRLFTTPYQNFKTNWLKKLHFRKNKYNIQDIVWAVDAVAFYLAPSKRPCFTTALTGTYFLVRNGWENGLVIGVRNTPEKGFESHAWVKINDKVALGWLPDLSTYQPILTEEY